METKVVGKGEIFEFVSGLIENEISPFAIATLFAGDRMSCVDEAVIAEEGGQIIGIATVAHKGEQMSGKPTFVGLYVIPEFRSQGIGRSLVKATIEHCREQGLVPLWVDAISTASKKLFESLPNEYKDFVKLNDMSNPLFDMIIMS